MIDRAWLPRRLALVALLLPGCGGDRGDGPPTVHFGQDVCADCTMIISEERFVAAVAARADGSLERHAFDDVGCLFAWEGKTGAEVVARWVGDYAGSGWLPAEAALYVRSDDLRSPMGSGVAACGSAAAAEEVVREHGGQVWDWDELYATGRRDGLLAPPPAADGN